jgi:hypothetical protein
MPTKGGDVFGGIEPNTNLSDDTAPPAGTLFYFWSKESIADRVERNHRGFEELSQTREARELADERDRAFKRYRQRAGDRARQQRHRDVIREQKIASGWKPNQKRVSSDFNILCCWYWNLYYT